MTNLKQPALLRFDDFDLPYCKLVVPSSQNESHREALFLKFIW